MSFERRRAKRYNTREEVLLFLRSKEGGRQVTEPVPARLIDISMSGAGIMLPRLIVDRNHIFYAPLESSAVVLCLEFPLITTDEGNHFVVSARPVWLDRNLEDEETPFRIGVEFKEKFPVDILKIILQEPTD